MSSKCRKVLTLRQRLRSLDAKIDSKFIQKCEADILKHECSQLPDPEKHFSNELSTIMVCLESVNNDFMNGYLDEDLEPQCIVELERLQKELISDYKINPNVVFKCESVISQHCSKVEELRDGSVLHCIMGVIKDPKYTKSVPADCTKAIHDLLKVSEVVDDARLDPVLSKACSALLSSDCSKSNIGEDGSEHRSMKTLQCLMQNRDNSKMTEECARSISELEYFFIRDLSMDNEFKRSCKADAEKFCHVSKGDWKSSHGVDQLLINCLWKVGPAMAEDSLEDHLSPPCFNYIFGLMELDAQYFDMHPYVFKECLADALEHCHEAISSVYSPANATETIDEKTNVLYCLQSKIKIIRPNCMTALEEMMKNIEHYPTIDSQIRKSCSNLFARFCSKNDHKDSLRCLIKHKNTDENNPVCKAAIDHVQIMQMQDLELSTEFKQACNNDRTKLCKNLPKPISTHSIIKCLMAYKISELAELEGEPRIMTKTLEPKCAKMLSFEVFQQHEMVALDKDVTEKCAREIKMFCAKYSDSEGQILGCLRRNSNNLGVLCHRVVFIRELEEAKDSSVDAELMSRCRVPIQIYCPAHGYYAESEVGIKNDMFFCLLQAFKVDGEREHFSKDCRFVLTERMEEFQNDYRLDTNFVDNCMPDVEKFCSKELTKKEGDLVTYRGKILQCMKKAYMNYSHDMANGVQVSKYEFSSKICVNDIENHIGLSNLNYHFDPYLRDACQNEIGTLCANEIVKENDNKDELWIELEGSVTECLKNALMEKKISNKNCKMEISRKIDESRDDVSSDLLMSEACSVVLATKCSKVKPGQFRQMNCLLYLNEQNELPIRCKRVVEKRQQMWEGATKPLAPESLSDLYQLVSGSAIRHFFIGFFAALVAIIFIIGICAGRITKRVPVDMKRR